MDPQGNQQSEFIEARQGDERFNMSAELRTLAAEIGESLNTANDNLLEGFDPVRNNSETESLLGPLDDILKELYDARPALVPTSTAPLSYPMVSNTSDAFLPNFTSPSRNLTYGNFINNEVAYEVPCTSYGTSYLPSAGQNFMPMPSPVMQMPMQMRMPVTMHTTNPEEEDNDGPVYLNFNIGDMEPSAQPFQRYQYQQQPSPALNMGHIYPENNVRYMEFVNESGDTARARFFDNSAKGFRSYRSRRQNTMNAANKMQFGQPNIEGCSKYIYAVEVNPESLLSNETHIPEEEKGENSFVMKQDFCDSIESTTENIKTENIPYSEEPNILIYRQPLRTKRTVKENPELSLQLNVKEENETGKFLGLDYLVMNAGDVQIPTMPDKPSTGKVKRKEAHTIRKWEDELTFEEPTLPKCEVDAALSEKSRSPPVYKKKKHLSEEMFLGKRKRKSSSASPSSNNVTTGDSLQFSGDLPTDSRKSRTTLTDRDSYKKRNAERSKRLHDFGSARDVIVIPSSDSDLDDMPMLSSKSLKCPNCKKIFKTPRSLAIHQKRCTVAVKVEKDLKITIEEYLESEKEFDIADDVPLAQISKGIASVKAIEKTNEKIVDKTKTNEMKDEQHKKEPQDETQENPLRRNTRSLTNLIASRKLGQTNEKSGQGKIKTATKKETNVNLRSTRRKKGK